MLYLDTSALVKLIRREPESDTLADWLDTHTPAPWVSSVLIEVELPRALHRIEPSLLADVPAIVARVVAIRNRRAGAGRRGGVSGSRAEVTRRDPSRNRGRGVRHSIDCVRELRRTPPHGCSGTRHADRCSGPLRVGLAKAVAAQRDACMYSRTSSILAKPPRWLSPERTTSSASCRRDAAAWTPAIGTT